MAVRNDFSPNRIIRSRQDSLTARTNLSACASRCCWPNQPAMETSNSRNGTKVRRIGPAQQPKFLQRALQPARSEGDRVFGRYGIALDGATRRNIVGIKLGKQGTARLHLPHLRRLSEHERDDERQAWATLGVEMRDRAGGKFSETLTPQLVNENGEVLVELIRKAYALSDHE